MAVRRERVLIELEDRFTNPMARSTAATALFRREVDSSGKSVIAFDKTTRDASPSIDRLSGRLAILTRAAAALGPGLIPITTAAIPALAGLATQLGFAAAGAGTAVLAFKGVGDALEALNEYQLDPTSENLAKVREEMRKLGPEAREFVHFLDEIGPQLQEIREAAQAGLLPGVAEGLDALLDRAPQVRRIMGEIANVSGDLARATGEDLASGRWDEFFDFLEVEARPALARLGQTVGHVASGVAELWMAFDPLSDDFTTGMLRAAEGFEAWASGLSETEGFQDFLAYIRQTGPQVLDLIGSLVDMLVSVGTAVAPLGGPTLTILTKLADVVAIIAKSDLGTPLFGAVAALSALSLASKGFTSVMETRAPTAVRGLTADLRTMASVGVVAWGRTTAEAEKYNQAAQRVRQTLAGFGKTTALVGGLALATSDLGRGFGLTNTASMALMGTMAGPWGAAVGGAAGLIMDLAAANDVAVASASDLLDTLSEQTGAITANTSAMVTNALEKAGILEIAQQLGVSLSDVTAAALGEEDALARVNAQIDAHIAGLPAVEVGANGAAQGMQNTLNAADKLRGAISGQNTEINQSVDSHHRLAEANEGTTDSLRRSEMAAARQAAALREARKALQESRKAARETAREFITLGDSLDDSKTSLRGWIRELERNARALRNFRRNAQEAAERGLNQGLIAALREAGPEGARRMRQLANATDAEIDRANEAWRRGQRQVRLYTDAVGGVPTPKLKVDNRPAIAGIDLVSWKLAQLDGKTAVTYIDTIRRNRVSGGLQEFAGGGTVPGQRYPYRDQVLTLLAPGEEVISNRHGQADRHRALLQAINANRYADGGTVAHSTVNNHYGTSGPIQVTGRLYGPNGTYADIQTVVDNRIDANQRHRAITGRR